VENFLHCDDEESTNKRRHSQGLRKATEESPAFLASRIF